MGATRSNQPKELVPKLTLDAKLYYQKGDECFTVRSIMCVRVANLIPRNLRSLKVQEVQKVQEDSQIPQIQKIRKLQNK